MGAAMKQMMIILSLLAMAAAALFWEQVWGIFAGMTVLESLDMIVTYILHVAVGTITAVVVFGIPKIVTPWLRMFQRKQRDMRRGRIVVQPKAPAFKQNRLTVDQLLRLIAPGKNIQKVPTQQPVQDDIDLRF
jgi:hypothetical protein